MGNRRRRMGTPDAVAVETERTVGHTGKAVVVFRPGEDGVRHIAMNHPFVA
jgi:hypothetical protein